MRGTLLLSHACQSNSPYYIADIPRSTQSSPNAQREEKMSWRTLRTEEFPRDVKGFAADNNDLLAVEELLRHGAGQAAKEMALAIDRDLFLKSVIAPPKCWSMKLASFIAAPSVDAGRELTTGSKDDILSCYTWQWEDNVESLPVSSTFDVGEEVLEWMGSRRNWILDVVSLRIGHLGSQPRIV